LLQTDGGFFIADGS